jgi:hypothetical protein
MISCSHLLEPSSEAITEIGISADMSRVNPIHLVAEFCLGRGLHYARNYDPYYAELYDLAQKYSVTIADWMTTMILYRHDGDGCVTDMA